MRDKFGKEITIKEFFQRWVEGMKNVVKNPTPYEKASGELQGTYVLFIGLIVSFVAIVDLRDNFGWLAYGLMLVFMGNTITTFFKIISLRSQVKHFKSIENMFSPRENLKQNGSNKRRSSKETEDSKSRINFSK